MSEVENLELYAQISELISEINSLKRDNEVVISNLKKELEDLRIENKYTQYKIISMQSEQYYLVPVPLSKRIEVIPGKFFIAPSGLILEK